MWSTIDVILLVLFIALLPLFLTRFIFFAKKDQQYTSVSQIIASEKEKKNAEKQRKKEEEEMQMRKKLEEEEQKRRQLEEEEQLREFERKRLEEENQRILEEKRQELERKRQLTIKEMLTTEESYLTQLKVLNDMFIKPVKEQNLISNQKVFDMIFPVDIQIITRMNTNFCNQLRRIIKYSRRNEAKRTTNDLHDTDIEQLQKRILLTESQDGSPLYEQAFSSIPDSTEEENAVDHFKLDPSKHQVTNLANLFLHYAPAFKLYVGFISKYGKSIEALNKETEKNKKFANFMEETRITLMNSNTNSMVHDYLITMIQRIPRYRLLLEDLLRNTEDDHECKESLKAAVKFISETAKFCNEKDREIELQMQTFRLQKKLSLKSNFKNPSRIIVEQYTHDDPKSLGKIQYVKLKKKEQIACDFYLFNDSIVFEKKKYNILKKKGEIHFIRENMMTPYGTVTDVQVRIVDNIFENRAFKVITTYKASNNKVDVKEVNFLCETAETCSHLIESIENLKCKK